MKMNLRITHCLVLLLFSFCFYSNVQGAEEDQKIIASNVIWVKPMANSFMANLHQTLEIALQLDKSTQAKINNFISGVKGDFLNPYLPEDLDFTATFSSPSGKIHKGFGFFYQDFREKLQEDVFEEKFTDYPWRLRFSPNELGQWKVIMTVVARGSEIPQTFKVNFACNPSKHKGSLVVANTDTEKDRFLYYKETGERFIATGMNVSSGGFFSYKPSQNRRQMGGVEKIAAVDGNFIRFEVGAQGALPDWNDIHNYTSKQDEMYAFDRLMSLAEEKQIYAIMFRHHVEIMGADWDIPNWKNNPYRKYFNMEKISDYFTNPEAIQAQKNNLRYMYARWGYSPYWAFYGYSEVEKFFNPIIEQEGISDKEAIRLFTTWIDNQNKYIREELQPNALFANSYGTMNKLEEQRGYDGVLSVSDIVSIHKYSTIKDANSRVRAEDVDDFWNYYGKPVFLEEMGINDDKLPLYCCTGIEFHNSIWSTAFMGCAGPGLDWWWDRGVMDFDYHLDLKPLQKFMEPIAKSEQIFTPYLWTDGKENSRTLEVFALKSDDEKEVYGWLHNATYYWRNLAKDNLCVQGLLDSSNVEIKCMVGDNIQMGRNESPRDYANERHKDRYSDHGVQPISQGLEKNPTMKIKDLLKKDGKQKVTYIVKFYATGPDENLKLLPEYTQKVQVGWGKNLKIQVPNLDNEHPDLAFTISLFDNTTGTPSF